MCVHCSHNKFQFQSNEDLRISLFLQFTIYKKSIYIQIILSNQISWSLLERACNQAEIFNKSMILVMRGMQLCWIWKTGVQKLGFDFKKLTVVKIYLMPLWFNFQRKTCNQSETFKNNRQQVNLFLRADQINIQIHYKIHRCRSKRLFYHL